MAEGQAQGPGVSAPPVTEAELQEIMENLDFFLEMEEAAVLPLEEEDDREGEKDEKSR